ncbi:hypothetical protein [Desulfoplanes formicivorans]|uniref:Uncharacterized protein n=1 Tax=Desulfoplanes formicivorans TaxID=1592317 RepID=A0A194AI28_9BACT|nr:hypothetical protein [Desulfoplanes formicivorans]GAU08419.1 hypothetical protein DPF_1127 [Desulfoplanes formicivorans]
MIDDRKLRFALAHWRIGVHLVLRTRHFGVNNQWWEGRFASVLGKPLWLVLLRMVMVYPLIRDYRFVRVRMTAMGMIHPDESEVLFGKK